MNNIRVGVVSSIDPKLGTAKVFFEELNAVTPDLQIIYSHTQNNKAFQMPDIGEQVLCLFLDTGMESGFIIGSMYSTEDLPPVDSADIKIMRFSDGTIIQYDRSTHTLTADVQGTAVITTSGDTTVTAPNITINGNVSVNGNLTVSGTTDSATTMTGGINLNSHTHPDAQGGNTGGPQ